MAKCDVFISYHRKSGSEYARMLQQALAGRGYHCFIDVDSVRDGEFREKILSAIAATRNFLFLLTDGALTNITDKNDHIRMELEEAIRLRKKIVIVAPRGSRGGFSGVALPDSLSGLERMQVSLLDVDVFFAKSIDMIEARFSRRVHCKRWIVASAAILAIVAAVLVYFAWPKTESVEPIENETYLVVPDDVDDELEDPTVEPILERMREIRLPAISFKPPATIVDAVEFLQCASKDFDRPDIPLEQRGFKFVLVTDSGGQNENEEYDEDVFANPGIPVVPMITASDITLYDAVELVCDSVGYKFVVRQGVVKVLPVGMSPDPLEVRHYDVSVRLLGMLCDWVEYDHGGGDDLFDGMKEDVSMSSNFMRIFLEEQGVKWPEGSSVRYITSANQVVVRNTEKELHKVEVRLSRLQVLKDIFYLR